MPSDFSPLKIVKIYKAKDGCRADVQSSQGTLIVPLTGSECQRIQALFALGGVTVGTKGMSHYQRFIFSRIEEVILQRARELLH